MLPNEVYTIGPKPSGNPVEEILTLMTKLPTYMENADALRNISSISSLIAKAEAFAECGKQLTAELRQWQDRRELIHGQLYWEEKSDFRNKCSFATAQQDFFLSERFSFPNSVTAYSQMLYWTAVLLVYNNHWTTCVWLQTALGPGCELLPSTTDKFSLRANSTIYASAYNCAMNIAKSLEYFLRPEIAGIRAYLMGFPMTVAMGFFQYFDLAEDAWFQTVLRYLRDVEGIPLGDFLDSCASSKMLMLVRV
jgi:hypothetical protein